MSHLELSNNIVFLKKLIRRYYSKKPLKEPYYLPKREIAIYSLEDQVYIRHLSFPSMNNLYQYITRRKTPLHLYYSSAYYEDPSAEKMDDKQWLGSDLIFDIDSDHFPGCGEVLSICINNNKYYRGKVKKCDDGGKPVVYPLINFDCIRKGWSEAIRLIDILRDDLGYKEIAISFSGNRGFHIHVYDEDARKLTGEERREIVDYLVLKNFDISRIFPALGKKKKSVYFTHDERGWRKRVLKEALSRGNVSVIGDLYRANLEDILNIIEDIRLDIDPVVTMDVSRLSRFDYSINGKSGLLVYPLDPSRDDFDELDYLSFSPFSGSLNINPLIDASLPVFDKVITLRRNVSIRIEAPYAIYLTLKGLVKVDNPNEADEINV